MHLCTMSNIFLHINAYLLRSEKRLTDWPAAYLFLFHKPMLIIIYSLNAKLFISVFLDTELHAADFT